MTDNNTITTNYTDAQLRQLVEEYIAQHCGPFTMQDICNYVLYWAMEDGHTTVRGLYDSCQLSAVDCERVSNVLKKLQSEGRITIVFNCRNSNYEILEQ